MIELIMGVLGLVVLGAVLGFAGWMAFRVVRRLESSGDGGPGRALLWRFGLVGGIALVMLIPLGLVDGLVSERAGRHAEAVEGIAEPWGGSQTVIGPALVVPVQRQEVSTRTVEVGGVPSERQTRRVVDDQLIILPSDLKVSAALNHQERERGIYKAVVYGAPVRLNATFDLTEARRFIAGQEGMVVRWDRAVLAVGLNGLRSLRLLEPVTWNGQAVPFSPGATADNVLGAGFHAATPLHADSGPVNVAVMFNVNGSSRFAAVPVGERSSIALTSTWPHPSFKGMGLPDSHEVNAQGFAATWTIPSLARSFPQVGLAGQWGQPMGDFWVGADLFEPVSLYTAVERAVKYGILFIGLTFALFLALELKARDTRLHPVQYLLVGLSMATFYLTLLALAEHLSFALAYGLAGLVSAAMIGGYLASVLGRWTRGLAVGAGQAVLYGVLFVVLQLEDFALLVGAALVLATLGTLMAVTRRLHAAPAG